MTEFPPHHREPTREESALTHAVDFVVGEVTVDTAALETAGHVATFLVTSCGKVWIETLVDVCESVARLANSFNTQVNVSFIVVCAVNY